MSSCYWVLEEFCTLKLEYPEIERCEFESIKYDNVVGLIGICTANESDLTEICEDCEEETDSCLCSEELEIN